MWKLNYAQTMFGRTACRIYWKRSRTPFLKCTAGNKLLLVYLGVSVLLTLLPLFRHNFDEIWVSTTSVLI